MKQPAEAPPGGSRKQIRKNDTERKAALRAADAAARQESINVRTQSELRNLETKEKIVEENIHRSMMKRVKDTIKNYQTQLKLLREMKEDYIEINGDEAYKSQLKDLMDGLFNAQSLKVGERIHGYDTILLKIQRYYDTGVNCVHPVVHRLFCS